MAGKKLIFVASLGTCSAQVQLARAQTPPTYEVWSLHAQATAIGQGHPVFHPPYSGENSLPPQAQLAGSFTSTLFLGRRLWSGAELYANPEMSVGRGFGGVSGIAAYPNGDLAHINGPSPSIILAQVFLRQTFELGVDQEDFPPGPNQLAGHHAISRLTLTVGQLTPGLYFDQNTYAHDPRTQFMNWGLAANGAWDYPANSHDLTRGLMIELNQRQWSVRYGVFAMPTKADSAHFDAHLDRAQGHVAEVEFRYDLWNRPGQLRLLGFWNRANMGDFRTTLETPAYLLDVSESRTYSSKFGFGISAEQELADGLGAWSRLGWNDGRTETWGFTDINESLSLGLNLNGERWGRPGDELGIGGIISALSRDQRDYLAAGGSSFIIGDGRLNYGYECVTEVFYKCRVVRGIFATLDYQFVNHPGYNRDRGPVSIVGTRIHAEF